MKLKNEIISYFIFGVLTTLVNFAVYLFFTRVCGVNYLVSNVIAWFISVLFAYITNRRMVFESENSNILKEIGLFYSGRVFSGALDTGLMYLFIDILSVNDFISKIVIMLIVGALNYIFGKIIVFSD